jgi:hypothetical protein
MALPSRAEQRRIVAKVDELMALCDRLESQFTTTQTKSRRLLEALVATARVCLESGQSRPLFCVPCVLSRRRGRNAGFPASPARIRT